MEPLAALSLASAVAQFLDFGNKIFRASRDIMDTNSTVSNARIGDLARDLKEVNSKLAAQIRARTSPQLSKEEQGLCDLAVQCNQAATELQNCLDMLVSKSSSLKVWKSLWVALCSVWQEAHIEKLVQMLGEYRSQLTLRLLLVLNSRHQLQDQKLDSLQSTSKEIVEVVAVNHRELVAGITRLQAETAAAIFTARDGATSLITAKDDDEGRMQRRNHSAQSARFFDSAKQFIAKEDVNYVKMILDALHFRGITERRSTISQAHKDTFDWVWSSSRSDQPVRWDSLKDWLQQSNGCFWLSGKAGSGKSSLMNYLEDSPQTQHALEEWSSTSRLVRGSFYFWYAGTDLQKSQTGLLQSLLLSVLSATPELCIACFPDVCRSIFSGKIGEQDHLVFTGAEVRTAFLRMITLIPDDTKVFFSIDGLDEYSGDHNEICDLLAQTASGQSIKILVSSRPIPTCAEKFARLPKLRLQDLTWSDVYNYTKDLLGTNTILKGMETTDPGISQLLIHGVVSKACGVFLWVVLVVRRLIECLHNYETRDELEQEMKRLPSDLEKLYEHMLGSQSEQHQVLGSKYLQLLLRATGLGCRLHLLQLSYAEGDDNSKALEAPIQELAKEASQWICQATEGRLRSRCCGLVETKQPDGNPVASWDKKVIFFHRTVVEFLQLDEVWAKLVSLTTRSRFDVDKALSRSVLAEFKTIKLMKRLNARHRQKRLIWRLDQMLVYGTQANEEASVAFRELYLPEFKRVMHYHWHDRSLFNSPDEEFAAVRASIRRSDAVTTLSYMGIFYMSCLIRTPIRSISNTVLHELGVITPAHMVMHFVDEIDPRIRRSMARHILLEEHPDFCIEFEGHADKAFVKSWASRWLRIDGSPGEMKSVWEYMMYYIFLIVRSPESRESQVAMSSADMMLSLLEAMESMMLRSNQINVHTITVKQHNRPEGISEITLLAELLSKFWTKASSLPASCTEKQRGELADRCAIIEAFIKRHFSSSDIWLTLRPLVEDEEPHAVQTGQATPETSPLAQIPHESKTSRILRKLFGSRGKTKLSANAQVGNEPSKTQSAVDIIFFETPWVKYKRTTGVGGIVGGILER